MLVFVLIAALAFFYYATVKRSTAHLIARNFVHLNEVSQILTETAEVMRQLTRFAEYYDCQSEEKAAAAAEATAEAKAKAEARANCLRDRLVDSSPYVTSGGQITLPEAWISEGQIQVDLGGLSIDLGSPNNGNPLRLTVPFENIDSLTNSVQFFDTLLIADNETGKVFFNSATLPLQADSGLPETYFFDSGSYERYATIAGIIARWREMEASRVPRDETAPGHEQIVPAAAFSQSTIVPVVVGGVPYLSFVQPLASARLDDEVRYVIGMVRESSFDSARYSVPLSTSAFGLLFLVVLVLSLSLIRILLIEENGIVGRWNLYILIGSVLGLVALLTLVFTAGGAWYRLGKWQDEDLNLIANTMSTNFQAEMYDRVRAMQRAEADFNQACYATDGTECRSGPAAVLTGAEDCTFSELICPSSRLDPDCVNANKALTCSTGVLPEFATLFSLDANGIQRGIYATVTSNPLKKPINVASREYFQRVLKDDLWSIRKPSGPVDDKSAGAEIAQISAQSRKRPGLAEPRCLDEDPESGLQVFFDRIKSRSNGHLETVVSTRACENAGWWVRAKETEEANKADAMPAKGSSLARIKPTALVAITRMRSFENVVLPPGFGYVVIASDSGKVLFHHNPDRSLLENFYDVIGHDLAFKTHIATGLPGLMNLTYKGDNIRAAVQTPQSLPVSIVTYYRFQPLRTLIFQFSVSAFVVALAFLCYQFVAIGLLERGYQSLNLAPPRHRDAPVKSMWQLNCALFLLACVYLLGVWYLEAWPRLLLVAAGPLLVYSVARLFGARFLAWVMGGPSRTVTSWYQNTVLGARVTVFLLALLLGVLPTLAIFYESLSLYEHSWRQLDNWSHSRALARRVEDYGEELRPYARPARGEPIEQVRKALGAQSGFYLPDTTLRLKNACAAETSGDSHTVRSKPALKTVCSVSGPVREVPRSSDIALTEGARLQSTESRARDNHPLQGVLAWLPDMTLMRSMLERFAATGDSWLNEQSCASDGYNDCWEIADAQQGISYAMSAHYPVFRTVTRSQGFWIAGLSVFLLSFLWLALKHFLNIIAPVRLIRQIRAQSGNEFSIVPPRARSFYTIIPAQVGESEKRRVVDDIAESYKLAPVSDELLRPFLAARELGDCTVVLLRDFETLVGGDPAERPVREWLLAAERRGSLRLLVVSRLDLGYLRTRQMRGEKLSGDGQAVWELLLTEAICVPFYKFAALAGEPPPLNARSAAKDPDDTLYLAAVGSGMEPRDYYRQWELCSADEKIALASLAHNGVTNVSNLPSLFSLYNRGLITVAPLGLNFRTPPFADYVRRKFPLDEFKAATAGYHDDRWRIFRAPLYILLGAVALFVAYSVQDELANVIKVFGGFGATLGVLKAISERYRISLEEE